MAGKKKATSKKAAPAPIAMVDTFFKTDTVTMNPEIINAITSKGSQIEIHTYAHPGTVKVPAEKDENGKPLELEVYTARLCDALEKKHKYNESLWAEVPSVACATVPDDAEG